MAEAVAGFDLALVLGAYGPLSLPRNTADGFGPEDEDGETCGGGGTWWPIRLRRDLVEGLLLSASGERRPAGRRPLHQPLAGGVAIVAAAAETGATRDEEGERLKEELLDEGRRRWMAFQEKRLGRGLADL
jgi:hypothetical protein